MNYLYQGGAQPQAAFVQYRYIIVATEVWQAFRQGNLYEKLAVKTVHTQESVKMQEKNFNITYALKNLVKFDPKIRKKIIYIFL